MYNFPKRYRLSDSALFQKLIKSKSKITDIYFDIYLNPNNMLYGRIGFAIPKASILRATARNRVKRIGRDFFRQHNVAGVDVLFVAKKYISELSNHEIVDKLTIAWQSIKKLSAT